MKVRNGFVSNSSTSSFLVIGIPYSEIESDDLDLWLKNMGKDPANMSKEEKVHAICRTFDGECYQDCEDDDDIRPHGKGMGVHYDAEYDEMKNGVFGIGLNDVDDPTDIPDIYEKYRELIDTVKRNTNIDVNKIKLYGFQIQT